MKKSYICLIEREIIKLSKDRIKMQFGNNGVQIDRQMYDMTSKVTEKIHECEQNIKEISGFIPKVGEKEETGKDLIS